MASLASAPGRYGWLPGKEIYKSEFEAARSGLAAGRDKERLRAGDSYGGDRFLVAEDAQIPGRSETPEGYEEIAYYPAAENGLSISSLGGDKRVRLLRKSAMGPSVANQTAIPEPSASNRKNWETARGLAEAYTSKAGTGWMFGGIMSSGE